MLALVDKIFRYKIMLPSNHVNDIVLVAAFAWWFMLSVATRSNDPKGLTTDASSYSIWLLSILLATVWVSLLVRLIVGAIGNINVGITHKFGVRKHGKRGGGRRLGFLERWYVAHSRSGNQPGFSLALRIESSTTKNNKVDMNENEIRLILRRVSHKFPWLRAGVRRDGIRGVDSTENLKPVGIQQHSWLWGDDLYAVVQDDLDDTDYFEIKEVTFPSLDHRFLARILEQESHEEWQDEDPSTKLWRAVVIRSTDDKKSFFLVLSFHHLITDGVGAVKVAKAILEESRHASLAKNDVVSNELPPPLEDVVDTKPRLYHMLLPVLLDQFPALAPLLQPPHWKGLPQHKDLRSGQCKMVCLSMGDETFVQNLRSLCQRKKLTVNSFAVTLLCRVVAQHIQSNLDRFGSSSSGILQNGSIIRFKIQQAVNLRPAGVAGQGNGEAKDLGCYLCGPQFYVTVRLDDCKVDQAAAAYQKKLKAAIPGACMDLGLCRFISEDWIEFSRKYERNIPNGRGDSIEVSNLGAVFTDTSGTDGDQRAIQPSPGWKLRGLWFAQGVRSSGPVLRVSLVSGPGGMNVILASIPEALPQADMEEIGNSWKQKLIAEVEDLSVPNTKS